MSGIVIFQKKKWMLVFRETWSVVGMFANDFLLVPFCVKGVHTFFKQNRYTERKLGQKILLVSTYSFFSFLNQRQFVKVFVNTSSMTNFSSLDH
jgi:hypothetical protein